MIKLFTSTGRSDIRAGFSYWFAHWKAVQKTALFYHVWKPKFLLHDMEKPWMRIFMDEKKVSIWHREHSRHHVEYGKKHGLNKVNWTEMVIDFECARQTKPDKPLNARQTMNKFYPEYRDFLEPILEKLGL